MTAGDGRQMSHGTDSVPRVDGIDSAGDPLTAVRSDI